MIESKDLYLVDNVIPTGSKNALTLEKIADLTGLETRRIKSCIQSLRVDRGMPIVSSAGGGYFYPKANEAEDIRLADRFVKMQSKQATNRFESSKPIKLWLDQINQIKLGDA